MSASTPQTPSSGDARQLLRRHLLKQRTDWSETPAADSAQQALQAQLLSVLQQLEPQCLGLYWPIKGEFNPRDAAMRAQQEWACQLALPWAHKTPRHMDYRPWQGQALSSVDDCGIPAPEGRPCQPDVVIVPCVGFTREGFRLGYGGGYFDRYLADHPGITAIGVAWAHAEVSLTDLAPQAHDLPLMAVITEDAVWSA